MGVLARTIAALIGIDTVSVWDFIAIAVVGDALSSGVVLAFTVALSISSFRRGWDLDSVGAVLVTVAGDVVTLPALFLASFLSGTEIFTPGGWSLLGRCRRVRGGAGGPAGTR